MGAAALTDNIGLALSHFDRSSAHRDEHALAAFPVIKALWEAAC